MECAKRVISRAPGRTQCAKKEREATTASFAASTSRSVSIAASLSLSITASEGRRSPNEEVAEVLAVPLLASIGLWLRRNVLSFGWPSTRSST